MEKRVWVTFFIKNYVLSLQNSQNTLMIRKSYDVLNIKFLFDLFSFNAVFYSGCLLRLTYSAKATMWRNYTAKSAVLMHEIFKLTVI